MKTILTLIFALLSMCGYAQITIHGSVLNSESRLAIKYVNVILQNKAQTKMYRFTTTKDDGFYSLSFDGIADTLRLSITGVHIEPQTIIILPKSQRLDIFADAKVLKIKEVIVMAQPIKRQGDTLKYNVGSFISIKDRSIEDVLKNMPGIEIEKTGQISYNGRSISKLYVEGMDMLGGRYSLASKNIQAKHVGSVEIYENHQAVKALRDIIVPDAAALNLKLKDAAKGVWSGGMQVGAGYKPGLWNGELTGMYFSKKFQTISTYKTNNTGNDVSRELKSFYGGIEESTSIIGVQIPTTPPLDEERYLNNNIHTVAVNAITKLEEDVTFRANASYVHDYQTSDGESVTTHFISGAVPIVIEEFTHAAQRSDKVNLDLDYTSNKKKTYFQNTLKFKGTWDRDFGEVLSNGESVSQSFEMPRIAIANDFTVIRPIKNLMTLNFKSNTNYTTQPTSLRITPMIYPEIFGSPADYPNAQQELNSTNFRTKNSAHFRFNRGGWNFFVNAGVNAHIEWLNSGLSPMNTFGDILPTVDSMRNDILWQKVDFIVGPSVGYKVGSALNINAHANVDFMSLKIEDRIHNTKQDMNKVIINPSISINGTITHDLKYSSRASYNEYYGGLYDSYGGFIMTDYRNISNKQGDIRSTKIQNYSASLNYGNAIRSLFGSIDAAYWKMENNLTYGANYIGSLTYIESYAIPTSSDGYRVNAKASKLFSAINTMFNISGGYSQSWNMVIRQDELIDTRNDLIIAGFGLNTRFSNHVTFDYNCEYIRRVSHIENVGEMQPIDYIVQKAELILAFTDKLTGTVSGSHYYNGTIASSDRNMFFLDALLTYKTKRVEYMLEARNLLNTGVFSSASTTDITNYVYSYNLRPISVMFKVKFSF